MSYNSKIYNIDWKKLTAWLIMVLLRTSKLVAFNNAGSALVNDLHTRFIFYKNWTEYRLGITPQTCYLEKLLNDRFDVVERRIVIVKGVEFPALPLYLKAEGKPVNLFKKSEAIPLVLYTKSETQQFTVDFIIKIPVLVPFDLNELKAYLDGDVLPSKIYKVQIV